MNTKKGAFMMLFLGIVFILIGIVVANSNKEENNYKSNGTVSITGELRDNIAIKSKDINSRKKVIIPSAEKDGFYCGIADDFDVMCDSKNVSLSAKLVDKIGYKDRANPNFKLYQDKEETKSIEEIKCIENAICHKVVEKVFPKGTKDILLIYLQGGNEHETFEIEYTINKGKLEDYLDYILDNIKITNDAEYKIGTVEGNQLKLTFKSDNNSTPFAKAEMILDANKYQEVENGINKSDLTTVRMATGGNIILSFKTNNQYYYDDTESYYFDEDNGGVYILIFTPEEGRDSGKVEKIEINGKTIFKRYYNYSIDVGKNVMINVAYMDGHIERTIEDFTNANGEILKKQ